MWKRLLVIVAVLIASLIAVGIAASRWRRVADAATPSPQRDRASVATGGQDPRGDITVDARRQQLIGVRTVRAHRTTLSQEIRAVGTIAYDETRQAEINTRLDGWIRELYADFTGRSIRRGEPLFTLYSPDLIASQNEYLLALRGQVHTAAGEASDLRAYSDRLVDAARERLLRLEMTSADIDELRKTGRATETITFRSPVAGVIVEKTAVHGMRVTAGQMLYRVTDLSTVWVEAEVNETDLPRVRLGTKAVVSVPAYPERSFSGRVSYIYPTVTEQTRTARVRVVLANPNQRLKPNMFATVALHTIATTVLVIPADAVVNTGNRQVVFVAEGEGRFTPRDVRVARSTENEIEVLSGLNDGDEVAAAATFFLDSESQLRGALQTFEARQAPTVPTIAAANLAVTFRTEPDPPRTGEDALIVTVTDPTGRAIDDAEVTVVLFMGAMPTMNMPAMRHETRLLSTGGGNYRGIGEVMTPGRWDVSVNVARSGQRVSSKQFALVAK